LYRRARAAGVVVVKSPVKPTISADSAKVVIEAEEPILGAKVSAEFELVVLADFEPAEPDAVLKAVGGLRSGPDGALQYDNVWLLPALTNRPGVFVVGGARGNSEYREALLDGLAAASSVHELLGAGVMEVRDDAAAVDADKCVLCLTCLRICPHGAISIDQERNAARVSSVSCQRCGICAAECPAEAIKLPRFTDEQVMAEVGETPRVTVFACENSAIPAADAVVGREYGPEVQLIRVPCAGKVDPRSVLAALAKGANRVLVIGCHPESCQYLSGSSRAARRIERLAVALEKAGYDRSRVRFGGIASVEPLRLIEYVTK